VRASGEVGVPLSASSSKQQLVPSNAASIKVRSFRSRFQFYDRVATVLPAIKITHDYFQGGSMFSSLISLLISLDYCVYSDKTNTCVYYYIYIYVNRSSASAAVDRTR
jgi:hypothetical protein